MGCCVSTEKSSATPCPNRKDQHSLDGTQRPRSDAMESRAPPPSADEETVKEVLSETPRPKPPPPPPLPLPLKPEAKDYEDDENRLRRTHEPVFHKISEEVQEEKEKKVVPTNGTVEEMSEISEICSLSESVSATTITRDDDDDDEVVRQRVSTRSPMKLPAKNRSTSGDLGARRDRVVGNSPTPRSNSSPGRRNGNGVGSARPVQSREPGRTVAARRALRTEPQRREPGESSARRSRSPVVTRTDGVGSTRPAAGRSPSARRSGRSPGRAAKAAAPVENTRRAATEEQEKPCMESKWAPGPTNSESLENPLVSLECFIFL